MKNKLIISSLLVVAAVCSMALTGCGHDKIVVSADAVASSIPAYNPCVKVFIENSGSMDGYMCDGSQLKDAVYDYVSDLNRSADTTRLYYINSQIIPYKGNLTSYIKDLNPSSFRKAGGSTANTDLGNIFASVLSAVNDTTVAVFVSDCILDLPSKDAKKFLTNCEIRIKDEIINARKRVTDLGVEVLKLTSDFEGKYFYPNGSVEMLKDVKRPYYMWIFGNKSCLASLNSEVPLSQLDKYGLSGIVAFANHTSIPFEIYNNTLTGKVIASAHGEYQLTIQADFSTTLQPNDIVLDPGNYKFNSDKVVLEGVYPISGDSQKYTHFIKFSIPDGANLAQECLTFYSCGLPEWVSESNDETGEDVTTNINKTTGIKYIIQGVADAYKNDRGLTSLTFNVKRK